MNQIFKNKELKLDNEIWKQIENSKYYAISNLGRVKRMSYKKLHNINKTFFITKEKILTQSINNTKKYCRICIKYNNDLLITKSVHRLVAIAFIDNSENKPQVNHIDGNKMNNFYTNLEWVTNQENMNHRYQKLKLFKTKRGSKCNLSKLKEQDMYVIAKRIKNKEKLKKIAKDFGVAPTTISEFKAGRSWNHLGLFEYTKRKQEKYNKKEMGLI